MELLPCPECGKQPKLSSLLPKHPDRKYFCGVHISGGDWKRTTNEAKEDWNRRVREYRESLKNIELKPCPFCGGEAHASEETKELGGTIMDGHIVWCGFCNCTTDLYTEQYLAIEAWNRRAT